MIVRIIYEQQTNKLQSWFVFQRYPYGLLLYTGLAGYKCDPDNALLFLV